MHLLTCSVRLQGAPDLGGWWTMAVGTMTSVAWAAETRAIKVWSFFVHCISIPFCLLLSCTAPLVVNNTSHQLSIHAICQSFGHVLHHLSISSEGYHRLSHALYKYVVVKGKQLGWGSGFIYCLFGSLAPSEGGTCSPPGCNRPKYVDPANNRTHDFCGRTHTFLAQTQGMVSLRCSQFY